MHVRNAKISVNLVYIYILLEKREIKLNDLNILKKVVLVQVLPQKLIFEMQYV